jgi:hypothetical protein
MNIEKRDNWIKQHKRHLPVVLLKRIVTDGEPGSGARASRAPNERKSMTGQLAELLLSMVSQSGVATTPARSYLIDVLRWHYGYSLSRGGPVPTAASLNERDAAFIRTRAHELVTRYANNVVPTNPQPAK